MFLRNSRENLTGDIAHEEAPFLVDNEKGSEMSAGDARARPSLAGRHRLSSFNIVLLILIFLSNGAWWARLNHRGAQEPITSCVRPQLVWCTKTR
jgi:hypothetical protein